ncbi:helix-turn-helix transcriptional regulator [Vibrio mediterranei]|uniref:helix-turn-helix domain-containing protein n=1 Tax=Vibrio mediterranei TaxID=689 RepID=UPI0038CF1295
MWQSKVKGFLARQQLSQEEFAFRIGLTQGAISRALNGHLSLKLDTLESIAREMSLSVSELLQDEYSEFEVKEELTAPYATKVNVAQSYLFEEQQAELIKRIERQNRLVST